MINLNLTEKFFLMTHASEAFSLVGEWCKKTGFEEFGFAAKFSRQCNTVHQNKILVFNTYRSQMSESYVRLKNEGLAKLDARVQCSVKGLPIGSWRINGQTSYTPLLEKFIPTAKAQLYIAGDAGLEAGITVPLQSRESEWGFFSFTTYKSVRTNELDNEFSDALTVAQSALFAIERISLSGNLSTKLSVREKEVLRWVSIGKTSWEISIILKISERTVNFHLTQAARKLGVNGRRAACTVAMVQGLIQFA